MNRKTLNLSTFFCLYLARAIPSTFLMTALQVTMRQDGVGLAAIGLLSLVRLPWSLKFLWAPIIDRHCVELRDFKRVIILTEMIFAAAVFTVGLLDVKTDLTLIIALVLLSTFAASVQNVSNDTLAVNAFSRGDHSAVNSMKSMGRYGGKILGGGVLLMVLHRYGWHTVVPVLGFVAVLLVVPLALNRHIALRPSPHRHRAQVKDFYRFFARREVWPLLGFLLLFFAGFDGLLSMLKPWMVDAGYDMKEIGLYNGVVGTSCAFVMAAFAGWWVKRLGLGRARLIVAAAAVGVPLYFLLLTYTGAPLGLMLGGIIYIKTVEASAAVTLYSTAMDAVRPGREGTDFTIQIVVVHFSGALVGVFSGGVGQWLSYRGLALIELVLAVASVIYIFLARRPAAGARKTTTIARTSPDNARRTADR